jgi:hypothetical protein
MPTHPAFLRKPEIGEQQMHERTIPYLVHGLKSLDALLRKAEAHCEARKIDPAALLNFRLYPDMFPFTRQVQLVTDFAKGCGARLAAIPVPSYADEEKTFAELHERIAKTLAFLSSIDTKKLVGAATRNVTVRSSRTEELTLSGEVYFNRFVLPNFYFHLATAYSILRHNGVELGKGDFLGRNL